VNERLFKPAENFSQQVCPASKQINVMEWKYLMYECFHSVLLLKQKYYRNGYCSETDLFRNEVNGQPLKKNAVLAHSHTA